MCIFELYMHIVVFHNMKHCRKNPYIGAIFFLSFGWFMVSPFTCNSYFTLTNLLNVLRTCIFLNSLTTLSSLVSWLLWSMSTCRQVKWCRVPVIAVSWLSCRYNSAIWKLCDKHVSLRNYKENDLHLVNKFRFCNTEFIFFETLYTFICMFLLPYF